jgi:CRISPR/Cas system endoribonuclease Cas6 (RAMP superfamily)
MYNDQNEQNQTEKKTVMYLTTDEMVGLLMEWAESYELPEWMERLIKNLQDKYDSIDNQPTEEDKISFTSEFVWGMQKGSFMTDVALRFLKYYNSDWVICERNPD